MMNQIKVYMRVGTKIIHTFTVRQIPAKGDFVYINQPHLERFVVQDVIHIVADTDFVNEVYLQVQKYA